MRRAMLAVLCVLAVVAGATPATATDPTTATTEAGAEAAARAMEGTDEGTVAGLPARSPRHDPSDVDEPLWNHTITFPVEGPNTYVDSFGACRDGCSRYHEGIDIMAGKMQRVVAAQSGVVTAIQHEADGNYVFVTGDDGWQYWYIHLNNDTPGTDDGKNLWEHAFAPGVEEGARVERGQHIAYVGDSGNAEATAPHLHFEIHYPDGSWGGHVLNPYYSLKLAQGQPVAGLCTFNRNPLPPPPASSTSSGGYWVLDAQGGVLAYGGAQWSGGRDGNGAMAGIAATRDGAGYWIAEQDGRVTPFGTARSYGNALSVSHAPIVAITRSRGSAGYWLLASNGKVFSYGDAARLGWPRRVSTPFVGMNPAALGEGYWLLDRRGVVRPYGAATHQGNLAAGAGTAAGMAGTRSDRGYWILTTDGDVHAFGDAPSLGSPARYGYCELPTAVRIRRTLSGNGYWVAMSNGDIHQFGDAWDFGDPNDPAFWHADVVDMVLRPAA